MAPYAKLLWSSAPGRIIGSCHRSHCVQYSRLLLAMPIRTRLQRGAETKDSAKLYSVHRITVPHTDLAQAIPWYGPLSLGATAHRLSPLTKSAHLEATDIQLANVT